MKTIYILRHGKVDKEPKVCDGTPLNSAGTLFSERACKLLENESIDYVVCDSTIRAIQTVMPLLIAKGIPYSILPTTAASIPSEVQTRAQTVLFCGRWEGIRGLNQVQINIGDTDRGEFYKNIFVYGFKKDRKPYEFSRKIEVTK